ncbi:MAG: TonB-dependent receptor [Ferruginibacter sp.]
MLSRFKHLTCSLIFIFLAGSAFCQFTLHGKITGRQKQTPVAFATVSVPAFDLWTVTDEKGEFTIKNIPAGSNTLQAECLGYVKTQFEISINSNLSGQVYSIPENNLALNEVVVTANKSNSLQTSFLLNRTVLDQMQVLGVRDATALMPGGKTNQTLHLATGSSQPISVNGSSSERGNAVFGVGVEVDGVRLSNNAIPGNDGVDTRNIASSNIESIEIITGIPSVEDGDATNGLVKITTRKGKSPFIVDMLTKPNSKQLAVSKGLELGKGVLNVNIERTQSVSQPASPYTTYTRNGLSLNYSNTFNKNHRPVFMSMGVSGNLGGYNSKSDPDLQENTYSKMKDNVLRANYNVKWLLQKKWITNIEATGTVNYNNRLSQISDNKSASASVAALHTTQTGYFVGQTYDENPDASIILIEPGYWTEVYNDDSRMINYSAKLKGDWSRRFGNMSNKLMAGGEYSGSGNMGRGEYYRDMRYAPTWREYRYSNESYLNNYALFAENKMTIPVKNSSLQVVAGLRSDFSSVNGSEYGTVSNLAPRANVQYTFWEKTNKTVSDLSVKLGWGKTVKLPSFSMLYPLTRYRDILTFAPGTTADGRTYYAYHTETTTRIFNPDLKWQTNVQREISVNMKVHGNRILLVASHDKTSNPYSSTTLYNPFTYKFTDQRSLENSAIPINNRVYTVDQTTGVVTVSDRTGALPAETLAYTEYTRGISNSKPVNGSPVTRKRLSWIVDFAQIRSIRTTLSVDGNLYYYKGIDETVDQYMPNSTINMANGQPYKYIGIFTGGASSSNGSVSRSLNMNITATTHIPSIRLIIAARLEGSYYNYSRYLSESSKGQRGFVLDSRDAYEPSATKTDIYGGDRYVGLYPDYYVSFDDMQTLIPFAEKFQWAKTNDVALYNELAKMVVKSNTGYYFNKNNTSAYFSANFSITKEIGKLASVTFNATNFFNNMAKVRSTWSDSQYSLYESSLIPAFYYGLSMRLKL